MKAKRILFITQEITPFVPETTISKISRALPQAAQENGAEVRIFTPKWGIINIRRNQLHEVIRLSGMNLIIDDTDHPLIIRVASLQSSRSIQVYFIENDDYFQNRLMTFDEQGVEYPDNDERTIFFARGVLEAVKKQRWSPDVIHCQGWISHLLPLYLKKAYKDDPIFSNSKIVLSLYDDTPQETFPADIKDKILFNGITEKDLEIFSEPSGINLAKLAASYSDGIIMGSEGIDEELVKFCKESGLPVLDYNAEAISNGSYIEDYKSFYDQV